jgi:acyl carrier protein
VKSTEVAALVKELLDIDQVTPEDNFFDLGGNSILALTLISEIKERYGATLPLIDVIRNPTPAGLAQLITQSDGGRTVDAATPMTEPGGGE